MGIFGCRLSVIDIAYEEPNVSLVSKNGVLKMTAVIPGVHLGINGKAEFCLLLCVKENIEGVVNVNKAIIRANVTLPVKGGKVSVKMANFRVKLSKPIVELTGGTFDDILIVEGIVNEISKKILPLTFQRALKKPIKRIINKGIRKLDLQLTGNLLGKTNFDATLVPSELIAVEGGLAIRAGVDLGFSSDADGVGLGFRRNGQQAASVDASTGMSAALSVDAINQVAWKATKAGLLNLEFCANTAAGAPNILGADYRMTIEPVEAPYIELVPLSDSLMSLRISALPVTIDAYFKFLGSYHLLGNLETFVGLQADVSVSVINNRVQLDVVGLPIVNTNIDQGRKFKIFKGLVELTEEERVNLSNALSLAIIKVMPGYVDAIESVLSVTKLPTLEGLSINPTSFYSTAGSLVMNGELVSSKGDSTISFPMPEFIQDGINYCSELP